MIRTIFSQWTGPSAVHIRNEFDLVYDPKNDRFDCESKVAEPLIPSVFGKGLMASVKVVEVPTTQAFRDGTYTVYTHDTSTPTNKIMELFRVVVQGGRVVDQVTPPRNGFVV